MNALLIEWLALTIAADSSGVLALCVLAVAGLVMVFFIVGVLAASRRSRKAGTKATPPPSRAAATNSAPSRAPSIASAPTSQATKAMGFKLPQPPAGYGKAKWIAPGSEITVAGRRLPGGMIYVGTSLPDLTGSPDPCLIDPSKPVAPQGDCRHPLPDYWPRYADLPPSSRAAYLTWLEGGRRQPDANIGHVFLFFYGLERRVILDPLEDPQANDDAAAIEHEIRELLAVYGEHSASFRGYATGLLAWMHLSRLTRTLYDQPLPVFERGYELPIELKVALGQAARDGVPVPAPLSLAWVRLAPEIRLTTPAKRCPELFDQLFMARYLEAFEGGLVLRKGRTKLRYDYRAASAGLRAAKSLRIDFGEIPDVTVLTATIRKMASFADEVAAELGPYSRYIGRKEAHAQDLEARLLLPFEVWPDQERSAIETLRADAVNGPLLLPYQGLLNRLGGHLPLPKNAFVALQRVLRSQGLGMEPDVSQGAKLPDLAGHVVVFASEPEPDRSSSDSGLTVGRLMLQFAAALATADGTFDDRELDHLRQQISSWTHLSLAHRQRLAAHLLLLRDTPVKLTTLKKRLEPLPQRIRESIAPFLAVVAQSDGVISPHEVKTLEKIYKALGLDPGQVFQRLHSASGGANVASSAEAGLQLDPARIAQLQEESRRAAALLATIFVDETPDVPEPVADVERPEPEPDFLGLKGPVAQMARVLVTRAEWSRADLQDVASDLDLMLDGALEQINDAFFDRFDLPLTEGEDPLSINADAVEKLSP